MSVVTVRNLPEATHHALKLRAAQNKRSTEAEIRKILEDVVRPPTRLKVGSALAELGQRFGGVTLAVARNPAPTEPAVFE
jgi:plasmid stability protein